MPRPTPKPKMVYSDDSSSYWPPGWDFARFRVATAADRAALPAGELEKMQAGLRDVLGEAGVGQLAMFLFAEEQARASEGEQQKIEKDKKKETEGESKKDDPQRRQEPRPDWLRHWRKHYGSRAPADDGDNKKWGFVVFCAVPRSDETGSAQWEQFKTRVERIARAPITQSGDLEAAAALELRWADEGNSDTVEEGASVGVEVLRERYREMVTEGLPPGLAQGVFLCASPGAVASLLDGKEGEEGEGGRGRMWRVDAPFLVAVAADGDPGLEEGHEERGWFKPVFKVAVETAVEELWWLLDAQIMPLRRITRFVKGTRELGGEEGEGQGLEEIWWSMAPSPERLRKKRRV